MSAQELKIGILFSLTGPTGITERGQYQASLLAIRQINEQGGIRGKRLVPIVEDIASDPYQAVQKAEKLILQDQVVAIVGLYTSACRKMVIPVLEKYNTMLFYPTLYEGVEQHRNIVYCGSLPNQQLLHFIPWIIDQLGSAFYLIGSDYIYPKETNRYIKHLIQSHGGSVLGETYVPLGDQKFHAHLHDIRKADPDVIFSTLVGDSVGAFYQQHSQLGLKQHITSSITAETEIASIQASYATGHYSSFPYFSSVQTKMNQVFVSEYRATYGTDTISSVMENAYNAIFLLSEALRVSDEPATDAIRRVLPGLKFEAPQGTILVDHNNQHLWLNSRIGQVSERGQFRIVWESNDIIPPVPFFETSDAETSPATEPLSLAALENRLAKYELFLKEMKNAVAPFPFSFTFFDADGVLLDVFQGTGALHPSIEDRLRIGCSQWTQYPLNKTGIGLALTGHTLSYVSSDRHDISELKDWVSAGLPVTSWADSVQMGVLGVFIQKHFETESSISLLLKSLSTIASFCAELQSKQAGYHSLSKVLQDVTGHLSKSLFVLQHNKILFRNQAAQELFARKRDIVHTTIAEITSDSREDAKYMMRKEDSDTLYEIQVTKSADFRYVYFKPLSHRTNTARRDKGKLTTKDLIGSDPHFLNTVSLAKSAAKTNANVLLLGESGTGKELFARAIHNESSRKEKLFLAINCAAIPKELINAELFGYTEGAFTGAKKGGSTGKFEAANGGTLFLDEIGDMPFELQSTLLRVLQEKEVIPVGGHKPIPINVRIIAATNKNLIQEIAYKGSFRSDLFYRLNVFTIELLPLRQRIQDVGELALNYVNQLSDETGQPAKTIVSDALRALMNYTWQGNIRELNNIMERAFYLADRSPSITIDHLPQYLVHQSGLQGANASRINLEETFRNLNSIREIASYAVEEKDLYIQTLLKRKGNISQTAKDLGISRTTLYKKLEEYDIKARK